MSSAFPTKKEKRSRPPPSEANNSFVKNVTSRVSGLLPATFTKWFSSPSSTNANGSAQTAEVTDSSTEDEGPESSVAAPPASKRMRFSSPGNFNHYSSTDTNSVSMNAGTQELEQVKPYTREGIRREKNNPSKILRDPNDDSVADRTDEDMSLFRSQHSVSTSGHSVATKRKSLFDTTPERQEASVRACAKTACNTIRDLKQPCFKPSLLGSPFYPGRTMYGGAASSYINQPNIKQRKNAVVNESNTCDNTVSHATRQIMDLLEHYSSPLSEAKRIPQYSQSPRQLNSSFKSSIESAPPTTKVVSYKTQELHLPSIASIMKLKKKSRLMDTTNTARQIIASHSSTSDYLTYPSVKQPREKTEEELCNSKLTTKVKSKLMRQNRGENVIETELPTPVNLPSAVLQIDQNNLPKFSFTSSLPSSTLKTSTTTSTTLTVTSQTSSLTTKTTSEIVETPLRKAEPVSTINSYKFSSPVKISSDHPQSMTDPLKFTFGSPERSIDTPKANEKKDDKVSSVTGASKEPDIKITAQPKWQCPDCWVFNNTDANLCICCGGTKPSKESKKVATCSLCKLADSQPHIDKCINCEKVKLNNVSKPTPIKQKESSKWKCDDCWVENDEAAEKCACCGANRCNKKPSAPLAKQSVVTNNAMSDWKCEDCWIKNNSSADKCVACGGAKPGAEPSSTPAPVIGLFNSPLNKPQDSSLKIIAKSQTDKWECPDCLVRNESDRTRCICCEAEKPGSISEADKKSFNFGMSPNVTFKFGIDVKAQEASVSKPIELNTFAENKKIEESETNNNNLSKTPSFTFGVPARKPEHETDSAKNGDEKVSTVPQVGFTFGIPKSTVSEPEKAPMFGVPNKLTEPSRIIQDDQEKPQEVPKIDFLIPKTAEAPKTFSSIFTPPPVSLLKPQDNTVNSPVAQEKPPRAIPAMNSYFNTENKDPQINSLTLQTTASNAITTAPPQFSFGTGGGLKIKTSNDMFASKSGPLLFGSPPPSAPNTTSVFQKNESATSTSAMSLFPKSDAPSTVSLFQKSEVPASTAVPPALGATAPLFNFGGNTQSTQPEKPKFNFTFDGNNKSDVQSPFKPTFGVSTENKFTLPTGNAMGTPNSLSGNTLGNALGSTGMSTNPLGGNTTNPLGGVGNDLSNNPLVSGNNLQTGNSLQPLTGGIFGAAVQKENMWSTPSNTVNNLFVSTNASTNSLQKPAAFTFGTSTPFNTSNTTPAFGNTTQPAPNVFRLSNQNSNSQPSLFSSPVSTPVANVFGNQQPVVNPAPALSMFGTPNVGAAPTFGTPNPSIPSFEAPSLTPAPAPTFNFGVPQSGVFGFGQQQQQQLQQQQPQQQLPQQAGGMYNFGAVTGGNPVVQFNMGSAPNTAMRRMRKAVRRNTPR